MDKWIILLGILLVLLVIVMKLAYNWPRIKRFIREIVDSIGTGGEVDEIIAAAGYAYDAEQDIFYTTMYAWQRNFGYCRLFDEAAAPLSLIIDCEPIYFDYAGKRWMIEFWKGQYAMATGCEVGVYNTTGPDLNIPGVFNGTFYHVVPDEELLDITVTLIKDEKALFTRSGLHWWQTGFILGEFSQPWELSVDITIELLDYEMCRAFVGGLVEAGYHDDEILRRGNYVSLRFAQPRTPQPYTRNPITDGVIQQNNKLLCDIYQDIVKTRSWSEAGLSNRLKLIKQHSPELYIALRNFGRNRRLYEKYSIIKRYL
ncbi:DUF4474 domain-containing protein [Dethiobacter alkaliphilus]|uniref:DUF4474 domain-containing protein n=1 Tax=Dethiobacter alkaliphilus TaxID=427926 RepID=UPI00222809ED|nr:DUF4474 domain-containing protein [Dethiobacter alkaliphilus]MCW3489710.1 DUF4474 domain-containing protein [Dethiobacter alkaliphilus]